MSDTDIQDQPHQSMGDGVIMQRQPGVAMLRAAGDTDPTAAAAFRHLIDALKADALAPGADFVKIAGYKRSVERMATRYAQHLPLTERGQKGGA